MEPKSALSIVFWKLNAIDSARRIKPQIVMINEKNASSKAGFQRLS